MKATRDLLPVLPWTNWRQRNVRKMPKAEVSGGKVKNWSEWVW